MSHIYVFLVYISLITRAVALIIDLELAEYFALYKIVYDITMCLTFVFPLSEMGHAVLY